MVDSLGSWQLFKFDQMGWLEMVGTSKSTLNAEQAHKLEHLVSIALLLGQCGMTTQDFFHVR